MGVYRQICGSTMEKCCCCSVRTACVIFAVLAMLGAFGQVFKDGKEIANHAATDQRQREAEIDDFFVSMREFMDIEMDDVRTFFKINFYITIIDVILCVGMIGATACLFYGVKNNEERFLNPLIWFLPFDLVGGASLCLFSSSTLVSLVHSPSHWPVSSSSLLFTISSSGSVSTHTESN